MSSPITLWIVSSLPPPVHGVSTFNQLLLEELQSRGVDYRFYRVGAAGSPASIGRWSFRKTLSDAVSLVKVVVGALARRSHDRARLVLYFTPSQGGLAAIRDFIMTALLRTFSVRMFAHLHGCGWLQVAHDHPRLAWFMRRTLVSCEAVICLGESFAKRMSEALRMTCISVNNGYPPTSEIPHRASPRMPGPIEMLYLGALLESKGIWEAARSVCQLRDSGRDARLLCAGEWQSGKERDKFLEAFRADIDCGTIAFFGHADGAAKEQLLSRAHFLVLPTQNEFEGQPLVLIEALRVGLVPLTTTHGGIPDLLRFTLSGRIARPEHATADGLALSVLEIVSTPGEYERLSHACVDHFSSSLRFDHCVDRILSIIASHHGHSH